MVATAFPPVPISRMRSSVSIISVNADGSDGPQVVQIWAALSVPTSALTAEENESAQAIRAFSRYQAVTRFRSDITTKMRAVYEGVTYEIHSVQDPDGYRRWLQLDLQANT